MTRIIWITGRAATGKTTLLNAVEERLRHDGHDVARWCDEALLLAGKAADTDHRHHYHPTGDRDAFVLRSAYLFDQGLGRINAGLNDLIDRGSTTLGLVELARGRRYPIDVSYRRALDLLDRRLWTVSTVIRLQLPFADQLIRNGQRLVRTGRGTPEATMHDLYQDDDPQALTEAGIAVTTLDANIDPTINAAEVLRTARLNIDDHNMSWPGASEPTTSATHK